MKYVVLLCDGMADTPFEALGNKTPMEAAHKPTMDALAAKAELGLVKTVPAGLSPGSDVANLAVLGYNAADCYTGRSPLEAANIGIDMTDTDVAMRCNLVTLSDDETYAEKTILDCRQAQAQRQRDHGGEYDFAGVGYRRYPRAVRLYRRYL